ELGTQRRQVLPRAEATRRGVPEDALDGRTLPVRGGGLAGGVRDAAGKELVDYLFRGGHVFLRGDALEERGDLLDALVAGAHLPGCLRPRLPAAALFAAREDRGQR